MYTHTHPNIHTNLWMILFFICVFGLKLENTVIKGTLMQI